MDQTRDESMLNDKENSIDLLFSFKLTDRCSLPPFCTCSRLACGDRGPEVQHLSGLAIQRRDQGIGMQDPKPTPTDRQDGRLASLVAAERHQNPTTINLFDNPADLTAFNPCTRPRVEQDNKIQGLGMLGHGHTGDDGEHYSMVCPPRRARGMVEPLKGGDGSAPMSFAATAPLNGQTKRSIGDG